ncbi:MAG TPA: hypothetical protein VN174_04680 [Candidatus Methanoperedens sp.]|nr:hypothetical protein [Candidatus Methanoperedens sp.]
MVDATKILQAIQNAGTEIAEQGVKSTEQVISTVVTGQELVADAKPMSDEEMAKAKAEDERKKQEEMAKLRQIPGRNVEAEMKQVDQEEKSEEELKQKEFLEKIKLQREAEERERENFVEEPGNEKRERAKHSMAPGKKKSSQTATPNASQMSATSEFKGGKID